MKTHLKTNKTRISQNKSETLLDQRLHAQKAKQQRPLHLQKAEKLVYKSDPLHQSLFHLNLVI